MAEAPVIGNRSFRRALITLNGLSSHAEPDGLPFPEPRAGPAWARGMIERLGFVQVDPISVVARAHHHILFSRNHRYRPADLEQLLEQDRDVFENWTHDHAILPVTCFPYWRHLFRRLERYEVHPGYKRYFEQADEAARQRVLRLIARDGPMKPRDLGGDRAKFETDDPYFTQPLVAKVACEFLWRTGQLGVARREANAKVYDLIERVVPKEHLKARVSKAACVDWACRQALMRLGAGTAAQIAHFFDLVSTSDVTGWLNRARDVVAVRVQTAEGKPGPEIHALKDLLPFLHEPPSVPRRLRLLNPFDPLTRDRKRALRVFGFDYTVEIFVPPRKRKYGYYVLPILEGERFVGRLDAKVDRKAGALNVLGLWWEPGVRPRNGRKPELERELNALAEFAGAETVRWRRGVRRWPR